MLVKLIELIYIFFKVGLFTVGGGMVAIPLIQQEVVDKGFITVAEFYNMVAVAESTPGPIGINIATYVGYSQLGVIGTLATTISFIIPSFFIVSVLAGLLLKYRSSLLVSNSLMYLKAAIIGLIGYSLVNVIIHVFGHPDSVPFDYKPLFLLVFLGIVYYRFKEKPWMVIIFGAISVVIFL